MMPRRRTGVWTNPQANGADECLPLLSDRERQRLIGGPNQPVMVSDKGANKHSNRRSNSRRGAPANKQQAQMARNDAGRLDTDVVGYDDTIPALVGGRSSS
jgi:hypothetical protein